jgi:hypothetical protein
MFRGSHLRISQRLVFIRSPESYFHPKSSAGGVLHLPNSMVVGRRLPSHVKIVSNLNRGALWQLRLGAGLSCIPPRRVIVAGDIATNPRFE